MSEHALPFFTHPVEGGEVRLGFLTPRDRAGILETLKARRREAKIANLIAAGIESEQIYTELESLEDEVWGGTEFVRHVNTVFGQDDVLRRALAKQYHTPEEVEDQFAKLQLNEANTLPLAAKVCNLTVNPVAPAGGEEENPTDPPPANPETGLRGYGATTT